MQEFWDQRYAENPTVYGNEPNRFFRLFIDLHQRGTLLLPAEGEGRNALYAASRGWQVDAFDFSAVARKKALDQAADSGLTLQYDLLDLNKFRAGKLYDAVALVYVHLPPGQRLSFHQEMVKSIKPGGFLVLEAFSKAQTRFGSGGPKNPEMLYDAESLRQDFQPLHIISCEEKQIDLNEGDFHKGKAAVLRLIAQK